MQALILHSPSSRRMLSATTRTRPTPTVVALKGAIAGDDSSLARLEAMMEMHEDELLETAMEEEEDDHYGHDAWSEAKILMDEEEEYGDEDSILELENSFDREEEFQSLEEE